MALEIKEDSDSWFINHPDYKDVQKTTYEKGTISDFEVLSEDPFKVSSRVKVTGAWGKSEYVPLFFRPKEKYWDTEDSKAVDFDSDGYYKKAWMSFRCDDEVVVMVREGNPVAVLGFYDGVPRIGENVFSIPEMYAAKYVVTDFAYYGTDSLGPDGVDLKLVQKAERLGGSEKHVDIGRYSCSVAYSNKYNWVQGKSSGGIVWCSAGYWSYNTDPDDVAQYNLCAGREDLIITTGSYNVTNLVYTKTTTSADYKLVLWPLKIGAILVAIFVLIQLPYTVLQDNHDSYVIDPPDPPYVPALNTWIAELEKDNTTPSPYEGFYVDSNSWGGEGSQQGLCIKAGVYSDNLLEALKSYFESLNLAELLVKNQFVGVDWCSDAPDGLYYQTDASMLCGGSFWMSGDEEMYYRPHTKEELQAAGLWPEGKD